MSYANAVQVPLIASWFLVAVTLTGGLASAQSYVGGVSLVYNPYSQRNLCLVPSSTWTYAQAQAQGLGGNLVTIHSAEENEFIANSFFQDFTNVGGPNLSAAYGVWIGLYNPTGIAQDDGPGGSGSQHAQNFVWVDGDQSTYRNWNHAGPLGDEPNNWNGEYYGMMWGPGASESQVFGTWNDSVEPRGDPVNYGVVELPVPEPSSLGALALGVLGIMYRGRRQV